MDIKGSKQRPRGRKVKLTTSEEEHWVHICYACQRNEWGEERGGKSNKVRENYG